MITHSRFMTIAVTTDNETFCDSNAKLSPLNAIRDVLCHRFHCRVEYSIFNMSSYTEHNRLNYGAQNMVMYREIICGIYFRNIFLRADEEWEDLENEVEMCHRSLEYYCSKHECMYHAAMGTGYENLNFLSRISRSDFSGGGVRASWKKFVEHRWRRLCWTWCKTISLSCSRFDKVAVSGLSTNFSLDIPSPFFPFEWT